jgi:hypothetical protein
MASPHAAGVAALIVSKFGRRDRHGGGLTLDPDATERRLLRTAVNHPRPSPRTYTYTLLVPNDEGIVNALRAVRR